MASASLIRPSHLRVLLQGSCGSHAQRKFIVQILTSGF
nr:MAG TPA_asm: hypothetical protein [Caudoviricetes sp.]